MSSTLQAFDGHFHLGIAGIKAGIISELAPSSAPCTSRSASTFTFPLVGFASLGHSGRSAMVPLSLLPHRMTYQLQVLRPDVDQSAAPSPLCGGPVTASAARRSRRKKLWVAVISRLRIEPSELLVHRPLPNTGRRGMTLELDLLVPVSEKDANVAEACAHPAGVIPDGSASGRTGWTTTCGGQQAQQNDAEVQTASWEDVVGPYVAAALEKVMEPAMESAMQRGVEIGRRAMERRMRVLSCDSGAQTDNAGASSGTPLRVDEERAPPSEAVSSVLAACPRERIDWLRRLRCAVCGARATGTTVPTRRGIKCGSCGDTIRNGRHPNGDAMSLDVCTAGHRSCAACTLRTMHVNLRAYAAACTS